MTDSTDMARVLMRRVENGQEIIETNAPTAMPEEASTINLVRRLVRYAPVELRVRASLHSKVLEGGTSLVNPSGADLEMAFEVAPGSWIELIAQAKRIDAGGLRYKALDFAQLKSLQQYAAGRSGQPSLLLYNAPSGAFACHHLPIEMKCGWFVTPDCWHLPHWFTSPLGATIGILPASSSPATYLGGDTLVQAISQRAIPIEWLDPLGIAARSTDGSGPGQWPWTHGYSGGDLVATWADTFDLVLLPEPPSWAQKLLDFPSSTLPLQSPVIDNDGSNEGDSDDLDGPWASIVIERSAL